MARLAGITELQRFADWNRTDASSGVACAVVQRTDCVGNFVYQSVFTCTDGLAVLYSLTDGRTDKLASVVLPHRWLSLRS